MSSSQPFKVVQSVELQSSAEHGKAKPKLKAGSKGSVLSESQLSETATNSDKSDLETSRVSFSLRQRPMRSEVALNRWRPQHTTGMPWKVPKQGLCDVGLPNFRVCTLPAVAILTAVFSAL